MTRTASIALAASLLVASARSARADIEGVCQVQVCPGNSKHPYKEISCSAPACECWDSCDGSSGNSKSGDAGKGYALLIAFVITFPFIPLVNIEFIAGKGDYAFGKPAEAKRRWAEHRASVRDIEQHGRAAAKETRRLESFLSKEEREQLRDAPGPTDKKRPPPVYKPIATQPAPKPAEDKAQEACSEQYKRERNATNFILAHTRYCVCSLEAKVCDPLDVACNKRALEQYTICVNATPTQPE